KDSGHSGYAFEKKDAERSRAMLWTVMSGFVVVGGVLMVLLKPALKHRRVSHIEQLRAAHGDKAAPGAPAAAGSATPAAGEPAPASQTVSQAAAVPPAKASAAAAETGAAPAKPAPAPAKPDED